HLARLGEESIDRPEWCGRETTLEHADPRRPCRRVQSRCPGASMPGRSIVGRLAKMLRVSLVSSLLCLLAFPAAADALETRLAEPLPPHPRLLVGPDGFHGVRAKV